MLRRNTRTVTVGNVAIGSGHAIAVQSMLCAKSGYLSANITQARALKDAGCDIVRLAIPSMEDVSLISAIKQAVDIPLVADIQFDYRLAIEAVKEGVDKIRINPGNIGGKDQVDAVVNACRERHIPIRIGVNSGSLEKNILQEYGRPTAEALVKSAMMHIEMLEERYFTDYLIAVKSSDVITTVEANRILAQKTDCPLHLGVTEAGTERMGIIKSSAGIGGLLCEGIGDTIRVSLTGTPLEEVKSAKRILKTLGLRKGGVEVVSCPTCGRTQIDLIGLANKVETMVQDIPLDIKVAVMGCVVNGPGEAKEADIGIAGGVGVGLLIKGGEIVKKVPEDQLLDTLREELMNWDSRSH